MANVKTRIRKNDVVQVIAGRGTGKRALKEGDDPKERGARGKVLEIDRERGRALVQGVKMVYKHQRSSRDPNRPTPGRVEKEAPVDLSNLMVVCPACDEATRIGVRVEERELEGGRKKARRVRVCRKCGADIAERS